VRRNGVADPRGRSNSSRSSDVIGILIIGQIVVLSVLAGLFSSAVSRAVSSPPAPRDEPIEPNDIRIAFADSSQDEHPIRRP
jgi:hypothetical protein